MAIWKVDKNILEEFQNTEKLQIKKIFLLFAKTNIM